MLLDSGWRRERIVRKKEKNSSLTFFLNGNFTLFLRLFFRLRTTVVGVFICLLSLADCELAQLPEKGIKTAQNLVFY